MADDLSAAPSGGSEAATSTPADSGSSSQASEAKQAPAKDSLRDTLSKAMDTVAKRPPNESEKALAVLKAGAGADDKAATDHDAEVAAAERTLEDKRAASERAKKGHETRRANAEKAAETDKQAETIAKAVGDKVADAVKPADKPAEKAADAKSAPAETKYKEAPQRFAQPAKADWEKVPESVRAEIDRSHKELEQGIQKYKSSADEWDGISEYVELSKQYYNQPLKDTLKNYADLDRLMHSDPLAAFEKLASSMTYEGQDGQTHNWTLKQLAEYIVNEDRDTFDNPQNELQRELADLKRELADIKRGDSEREAQRLQQDRERTTQSLQKQIEDFAGQHARFDELWGDVELELHNPKFAAGEEPLIRLKKAYEKVERLNPAPSLSPPAPDLPAQDTAAQTRKGTASITGAPGSGSNPAGRKPVPTSSRDALKAAFAAKGLSVT